MVMAPPPPSSTSTSSPASPPPPPPHSPIFSPINENQEHPHRPTKTRATVFGGGGAAESSTYQHNPTPLHSSTTSRKRSDSSEDGSTTSISCNKCRPSSRDKNPNSIIPLDSTHPSPNNIFKSILSSIKRKSPKSTSSSDPNPNPNPTPNPSPRDDQQWKLAVSELSHKLIQATRKRDEALMEASRLKSSMAELEKKLNKLEIYCRNLNTNLEVCTDNPTNLNPPIKRIGFGHNEKLIESFCSSVSEARSTVRFLSRSLTVQLRQMGGGKVYERISTLLLPYEVKVTSITKNPRSVLFYLEALLNRAFYEDFESVGFQKNGSDLILNPVARCEASYASYNVLQALTWEEVLNKGTRHFSEEFSRFCDRKMSEIVAMLGWNRAWPEPLLQAFFGAAKNVWLVHLLACSVHPSLPIFRVDKDAKFDGLYMEDMGGDKGQKLVPTTVRIMVAPGFYVYSNVVKCKVLCRYSNTQGSLAS